MPLRLNIGLSKKLGLPDYGSLGASCNLDLELDAALLQTDPEAFQRHARNAYDACRRAVQEELARHQAPVTTPANNPPAANGNVSGNGHGNGNGHASGNGQSANGNGNGQNGPGRPNGRQATASQVRAICGIAKRQKIDLVAALRERFGQTRPEDLSIGQASEFIDLIKPQTAGVGGRQ